MDGLFNLLCLLLGVALPLGLTFVVIRHAFRPMAAASAYRAAARTLGLLVDTRGVSLSGYLEDRRLWIGEVAIGHGPDRRNEVHGSLDLHPPLGLGFILRRSGTTQRVFRRYRARRMDIGDPDLARFSIKGVLTDRIHALFTPLVKQHLLKLSETWPDVMITDAWIQVYLKTPPTSEAAVLELVTRMRGLADALQQARMALPSPEELASVHREWEQLAESSNLDFQSWLPGLQGKYDGRRTSVAVCRGGNVFRSDLRLEFHHHRSTGLLLRQQLEPDGYFNVGQDIQLDSPDFDSAFVIKGYDSMLIRELLSDGVQAPLLALNELGSVTVDDREIVIRNGPLGAEDVQRMIDLASDAAEALGW